MLRRRAGSYNSKGELIELRQYYDSNGYSKNTLTYDNFGNIKSVCDSRGATLSYVYDSAENMFVTEVLQSGESTDVYKSAISYDVATQTKVSETDCRGNNLRYVYDGWQRIAKIFTSYDSETPAVSYEYYASEKTADSEAKLWYTLTNNKVTFDSNDESVIQTVLQIDGLGRAARTAKTGFVNETLGWNASGAVEYDKKGREVKKGVTEFIQGESVSGLLSTIIICQAWVEFLITSMAICITTRGIIR